MFPLCNFLGHRVTPSTPIPHSVRRLPPSKPVTPSTTQESQSEVCPGTPNVSAAPQREPAPGRERGEDSRCGKGRLLVNLYHRGEDGVVLVCQVRHQPRDGGRGRPDSPEHQ